VLIVATGTGCESSTILPEDPPPIAGTAGYTLSFKPAATHTVIPGEVLAIELFVNREDDFEEPVTLSARAAPGIVVIFRPPTLIHREESDLLVVAEQSSPRRTHQIEFTGRAEGRPDQTVTLSLTVVDSK
jgi:hypothetical protein